MYYAKHRLIIHAVAFLLGIFYLHWSFLGLCVLGHHFYSPAQAALIRGVHDIDDLKGDLEGLAALSRTVKILTLQSSLFSGLWYLVGLGLGFLF